MRFFLDANVLFSSAISPDGRCAALLDVAVEDDHELLASRHVVAEARINLVGRYPESVERFEKVVLPVVKIVEEAAVDLVRWATEQGLPDNDAPVLAASVASGAEILVTGDRAHFGHLFGRTLRGTRILAPRSALGVMLNE